MNVHSAHDLAATYDCKIAGCTQTARLNRGRFAYLCDEHKAQTLAAAPKPAAPEPAPEPTPEPEPAVPLSYVARVEALLPHAAAVDEARTKLFQAKTGLRDAIRQVFA